MPVDVGGGVGVTGKIARSYDGADTAASEASDARTLVSESCAASGEFQNEPPPELLREVVGLVSSVSRSA